MKYSTSNSTNLLNKSEKNIGKHLFNCRYFANVAVISISRFCLSNFIFMYPTLHLGCRKQGSRVPFKLFVKQTLKGSKSFSPKTVKYFFMYKPFSFLSHSAASLIEPSPSHLSFPDGHFPPLQHKLGRLFSPTNETKCATKRYAKYF